MTIPQSKLSRSIAKKQGLSHYFTGKPCKNGHVARRKTSNGSCLQCASADMSRCRMEDPQKFRERDARWIANNREQVRASAAAYSAKNRQAVTRRTAAWRKANPTRHAEHVKRYAQSRQHILRAKLARRRARKLRATPPWLTDEHKMLILAIYDQAVRLSTETGMAHEVDHIIPLQGDNVCGLHVPWNLRVTTMRANRAKGNRHAP